MQQNDDHAPDTSDDATIARMLRVVGRGASLPESTKAAWSKTFGDELEAQISRRRRSRQRRWGAGL